MADQSKTEKASPRRRQKARDEGQVARSRDLAAGLAAMTAVLVLASQMPAFASDWRGLLRQELELAATHPEQLVPVWRNAWPVFRAVALAAGLSWIIATAGGLAPGGLLVAPSAPAPNWKRLDPVSHVEQLFSLAALSRLLKSLLPTAVVVYFAIGVLVRDFRFLPALLHGNRGALVAFTVARMYEVAWKGSLVGLLGAGAEYFLGGLAPVAGLEMVKPDRKEEIREMEGKPGVKQGILPLQRKNR